MTARHHVMGSSSQRVLIMSIGLLLCFACDSKRPDILPEIETLSPSSSKGLNQNYQLTVRHRAGGVAIKNVGLIVSTDLTANPACWVEYSFVTDGFRVRTDDAKDWRAPAVAGREISSSQCTLMPAKAKATVVGERVTVISPIRFSVHFTGPREVWGIASSETVHSGWKSVGTWEGP